MSITGISSRSRSCSNSPAEVHALLLKHVSGSARSAALSTSQSGRSVAFAVALARDMVMRVELLMRVELQQMISGIAG
jgi:hypothetical protein